ncbi:unnamed protein product [Rotaria socialis]
MASIFTGKAWTLASKILQPITNSTKASQRTTPSTVQLMAHASGPTTTAFANVNSCVTSATNLLIQDNIGYGLWLSDNTTSNLTDIRVWNNGAVQIRLDNRAAGTTTRVSAWTPAWNTPPWRRYKESKTVKTSIALGGNAAYTPVPFWTGSLEIVTVPAAPRTYQPNEHHSCARRNNVDSKRRYHRSPTCSSSSWYPSTHGSNWH